MFIVSKALLISGATVIVRAGGCHFLKLLCYGSVAVVLCFVGICVLVCSRSWSVCEVVYCGDCDVCAV